MVEVSEIEPLTSTMPSLAISSSIRIILGSTAGGVDIIEQLVRVGSSPRTRAFRHMSHFGVIFTSMPDNSLSIKCCVKPLNELSSTTFK
jgi:hypothetical protein